jgi:hypothetical protein
VLRRIFGPKGEEVGGKWRNLHNEELHNLYTSPNIVRVINREERDGWGVERGWGRREACIGFWCGNLRKETSEETQA